MFTGVTFIGLIIGFIWISFSILAMVLFNTYIYEKYVNINKEWIFNGIEFILDEIILIGLLLITAHLFFK